MRLSERAVTVTLLGAALLIWMATPGAAQQVSGVPGSPSATTTIDGKYLPPPPPKFGGTINLLKGRPVFTYNALALARFRWEGQEALAPGKHTIVFDFKYDGPGIAKGGTGVLTVDGKDVATKNIPHTIPFLMTIDETFDVGMDTRTPVDDNDYKVPFRFAGTIAKLTFKLGSTQLTEADRQIIHAGIIKAKD